MDQMQIPSEGENSLQSTSYIGAAGEPEPKKSGAMKWVLIVLVVLAILAGLYFWIF